MAKFTKKKSGGVPAISTASLPDVVFMLLFFFMTVTELRNDDLMVINRVPVANQLQKLDKKDPIIYIYAGKPSKQYQGIYGNAPKIQIEDKFVNVNEVSNSVLEQRDALRQELRNIFTTALKVDKETNMGIISDIKKQLRDINALKLVYITKRGDPVTQR